MPATGVQNLKIAQRGPGGGCKNFLRRGGENWVEKSGLITITHKMITEPNFIIFELFSVIPVR